MRHPALVVLAFLVLAGCGGDSGGPGPDPTGVVKIAVTPDGLDADWTLFGPDGYERDGVDDARLPGLAPGSYSVGWTDVPGYHTPNDVAGILAAGDSLTLPGFYVEIATMGSVHIDLEPDELDAAWVLKIVAGGGEYDVTGRGDLTLANLPPGPFTVHWAAVPGWTTATTIHEGVVATGQTAQVDVLYTVLPPWPFETVRLPAGAFTMGSPENEPGRLDDEAPRRLVTLSRDILVAVTELTLAQWEAVTGAKRIDDPTLDNHPVTNVSWYEAIDFCNDKSLDDGLTPAYVVHGGGVLPDSVSWNPDADGWRLPTEAEWEALCRAGTATATSAGELRELGCRIDPVLSYYGWTCANAGVRRPVRARLPNPLGLYDVHGGVAEWCWDRYAADAYAFLPDVDPTGPAADAYPDRIYRGGSFAAQAASARSATRGYLQPRWGLTTLGIRLVRNAPETR